MKILTIAPGLGIGGAERTAARFASGYLENGHESAVLNLGDAGFRGDQLNRCGIPLFEWTDGPDDAMAAALAFKADVIHIHRCGWYNPLTTRVLQALRKHCRVRVMEKNIFGCVDSESPDGIVDVHLLLSRWCLWRWRRWLGRRRAFEIGVVLPNPADPTAFHRVSPEQALAYRVRLGLRPDHYVCGRVGQPIVGKWHPQTIVGFTELAAQNDNARLLLVGLPARLDSLVKSLPASLKEKIIVLPSISSDEELCCFYSSLDCFLHAAYQGESFGNVLAEAMLCGCPVVTASRPHRDNSQVEVVGHKEGGIVAGSVDRLGEALILLWQDHELRERLGRQARQRVITTCEAKNVMALASRVAEIMVGSESTEALRARLADDPSLTTRVDDAHMRQLLTNTLGGPRAAEMMRMEFEHHPLVHRLRNALRRWLEPFRTSH